MARRPNPAPGGATYAKNSQPSPVAMGCGPASRLRTAVACAMTMGIVGFVSACGKDADPVKSLAAAASEIAGDLNEAAIDVR